MTLASPYKTDVTVVRWVLYGGSFMGKERFISYLRVSTDRQGKAGLGIEAQRDLVNRHLGDGRPVQEFVEVESGKRTDRPQLAAALAACRTRGATLIIAKLDRLARNLHFISGLMESGVDFIAADNPHANRLTVHILSAVAEEEARMISRRTKDALAAAKARGVKLGNPNGARAFRAKQIGNAAALAAVKAKAARWAADIVAQIERITPYTGATSYGAIAKALNESGVRTPRGGRWYPMSVKLVMRRGVTKAVAAA
jgi:DNA invertase Pin-like site-specific DNA recombinase